MCSPLSSYPLGSVLYMKLYFLAGNIENTFFKDHFQSIQIIIIFQDYTEIFNGIQMEALKPITL